MAATKKIDWNQLHAEYLGGSMSLHVLCKRDKLNQKWFYRKTQGWDQERQEMHQKAIDQVKGATTRELRDRYGKFSEMSKELLEVALAQVRELYKKTLDPSGKRIIKPIKPGDLYNIVSSLTGAVKLFRLMEGKSTENISDDRGREYWLAVVDIANKRVPELPDQYTDLIKK